MRIKENSISIVTGATGGLGRAISQKILKNENRLIFIARDIVKINLFEKEIAKDHLINFFKIQADFIIKNDYKKIENSLIEIFDKNLELDEIILFNNASTIDPIALIEDVSFDEISNALTLNIASAYTLCSIILRLNKRYSFKKINIINISSGVSIYPVTGWSTYCISKAGLNMLTKCICNENMNLESTTIRSFSINPGAIDTNMQEKIRTADAEKIPAAKKFELMYNEGKLQNPIDVVNKLFRILASNEFTNGDFIDFNKIN
jgi:benzil reductase ((S)-benzoin forming)